MSVHGAGRLVLVSGLLPLAGHCVHCPVHQALGGSPQGSRRAAWRRRCAAIYLSATEGEGKHPLSKQSIDSGGGPCVWRVKQRGAALHPQSTPRVGWVQHVNQGDAHDLRTRWSAGHLSHTLILAPCLMRDTENWFLGLADKSTPPVIITCPLITRRERKKMYHFYAVKHTGRCLSGWKVSTVTASTLAGPPVTPEKPSFPPAVLPILPAGQFHHP